MQLSPTGERVVEEHYLSNVEDYLIYQFHLATYQFSFPYVKGKRVLDLGCGSGYGSALVADHSEQVAGVDISMEAVFYAREHYNRSNLDFLLVENVEDHPLPFLANSFDVVLSFQVIEHLMDVKSYLLDIRRILKPGGILLLATPDRSSRLMPFQKPWNVWHIHEFSAKELRHTLEAYFRPVEVYKMGGTPELLKIELNRVRWIRWLTLPFTLPFVPEKIRHKGLFWMKRLRIHRKKEHAMDFSSIAVEDIFISSDQQPSVNLIALARL